jgi:ABC-type transporter Mla maintaining outer membrane lipid asymmetry ATPase subunit MlaF
VETFSHQPNPPLIELHHVDVASAHESEVAQVEGVNWPVNAGDFWIVGGPHGSGKSDLLATAAALQRPLRGAIRLFGRDVTELDEADTLAQRRQIGFVFKHGGRMFAHLTVAENIALSLRYHHDWTLAEASEPVQTILASTGLTAFAHNTAGVLSAHWQRRVGLARALALKPQVLFLDEPLAGLEAREQRWWLDFLAQLSAGSPSTTLVVTTNDWQPWLNHGRQFAVVKKKRWLVLGGRAELQSSAAELLNEAADD